jgi:outer membrane protein, multidrug efflux system
MKTRRLCIILICTAGVGGCLVGPDFHPPQTQAPAHWSGESPASQPASGPTSRPVELATWWESFGDEKLSKLIDRATSGNFDLKIAEARVREARELRNIAAADFWPHLNLGSGYTYSRSSQTLTPTQSTQGFGQTLLRSALSKIIVTPAIPPTISVTPGGTGVSLGSLVPNNTGSVSSPRDQNLYQLGFDATWEIDLWGRIRRSVEATSADLAASEETRRDVLVTLISEVARNYVELRGSQRRLLIALENIDVQKASLDVSEARFKAGFTTQLDVAQARTQLETTRSQVPLFETAIRQSIYQLGVLIGEPPATLLDELMPTQQIPTAPPEVPLGLPSELLRRRPDIRTAEWQLAAVTARVGVATAELFPQLSLTGSFGAQSIDMKRFLEARSLFWSVGPSINWPIFEGGRIRANIRAEEAREAQALATYGKTVITAFQDVESSLTAYTHERTRRQTLVLAVQASQQATELSTDLYNRGLGQFIDVLVSERALYAAQDDLVLSETAVMTDLIALYKALGGGWESEAGTITTRPVSPENDLTSR